MISLMINPKINIWYLTDLLAAMAALLLRYLTMLIVVSAEVQPPSAYEIQGSGGKFNTWNSSNATQLHFHHTYFNGI